MDNRDPPLQPDGKLHSLCNIFHRLTAEMNAVPGDDADTHTALLHERDTIVAAIEAWRATTEQGKRAKARCAEALLLEAGYDDQTEERCVRLALNVLHDVAAEP